MCKFSGEDAASWLAAMRRHRQRVERLATQHIELQTADALAKLAEAHYLLGRRHIMLAMTEGRCEDVEAALKSSLAIKNLEDAIENSAAFYGVLRQPQFGRVGTYAVPQA